MSKSLLSYTTIFDIFKDPMGQDQLGFKKAGTKHGSEFNYYDTPGHKYFKILFYFENGDVDNISNNHISGGLLSPTWMANPNINNMYTYNSAYSYLMLNDELERADMLKSFISLLSNISSESPWYFKEVSGVDSALERNVKEMKFDEERKKISIKCLQDSYDDRIGSLMDLYRAIVWSWQMKREVLPANMRKFDMGIYIFNDIVTPFQKMGNEYAVIGSGDGYKTSYKYIEFHNCEFDYNSAKSPYGTLDNSQGLTPEYTIDIYFDDCYETHYNEFMMKEFGDMILWDMMVNDDRNSYNYVDQQNLLSKRLDYYGDSTRVPKKTEKLTANLVTKDIEKKGGFFSNAADQLLKTGLSWVDSKLKRAVLGNIYTYSLTKISDQISTLMNGGVMETANAVAEYITDSRQRKEKGRYAKPEISNNIFYTESKQSPNNELGDIFENPVKATINNELGDIFENPVKATINNELGNIFRAQTIANNL